MKSILINLDNSDKIKKFVQITSKYSYDIDIRSSRYVVNAKSILGIFSLSLNHPLVLEIYSDDCQDLIDEILPFAITKNGNN